MPLFTQNWTTHCGNNERNGRSAQPGPQSVGSPLWTVNSAIPTSLGMTIYSFGDYFITPRVDFSPYNARIECRDLKTGELVWTSAEIGDESILYAMGFNEDAVYAHDYHSGYFYALNAADGTVVWVSEDPSYTFAPMDGVIYTCERNLIINGKLGSANASTICLDKENGEIVWTNANLYAITPNETKASHGNHLYMITGAINQPIRLVAVDIRTGDNLYYSDELPGDADQEGPLAVGPDGTIFFMRDGGDIFSMSDNDNNFSINWTYTPKSQTLHKNYVIDFNGNLLFTDNGRIYRLDKDSGNPLDSSLMNDFEGAWLAMGTDSVIYVNNTDGSYYALSYDLQTTLWTLTVAGNHYAGPALSKDGIMVVCGAGSVIKAYGYDGPHAPVGDFIASGYHIPSGNDIDFTDQSSFEPTTWQWEFTGGTPAASTLQNPAGVRYDEPGIYDVILIVSNAMGSDTIIKQCLIEVENFIGLSEIEFSEAKVFPNPADKQISIVSEINTSIVIYNATGEMVYRDDSLKKQRILETASFAPGLYVIRFIDGVQGAGRRISNKILLVAH